jgi:hypothetical protein
MRVKLTSADGSFGGRVKSALAGIAAARGIFGKEGYFLSAAGLLMPSKKDQPPPDLKYFNRPKP